MSLPQPVQQRIIEAIAARAPNIMRCPVCSIGPWTLADGFLQITLQDSAEGIVIGGPTLPMVALVCNHCGNTLFFNLIALGLRDLVEPSDTEGGSDG